MTAKYNTSFLDEHRYINVSHDWWDAVHDDFNEICNILGIELNKREPSSTGFSSQGDGASWTGKYFAQTTRFVWPDGPLRPRSTYDTAPAAIREHAPEDEKLHSIADRLCLLSRIYTPVFAKVGRGSSHYVHDNTMQISEWEFDDEERNEDVPQEIAAHIEQELLDVFQELARWLYKTLEAEYYYLTSDEAVAETLEANEIEEEMEEEKCLD